MRRSLSCGPDSLSGRGAQSALQERCYSRAARQYWARDPRMSLPARLAREVPQATCDLEASAATTRRPVSVSQTLSGQRRNSRCRAMLIRLKCRVTTVDTV